jgi:DNA polymerase I-like protein with 3'-5' exonuclease and polymerase domains
LQLTELDAAPKGARALFKKYFEDGFSRDDVVPAWYRTKYEGGADTGLMCHAIEETANYKLELLAARYLNTPRYDKELQDWKTAYCKQNNLADAELEGYGECPDSILLPYGMYDADVTLRLFYKLYTLLDNDYDGNCCREAFWESQIATPAVLDIHQTGITLDRGRVDFLTARFMEARTELEAKIRQRLNWPDFNIRSLVQIKEVLFGHELNGKRDTETGGFVRVRPADAISLNLTPIFDTSKPPKSWVEIKQNREEFQHSPCTSKQVLSILAQTVTDKTKAETVSMLRDYRFLDQALKNVLRPPRTDDKTEDPVYDDEGNLEYDKGLASLCCDDGKIRTHMYQTKETGRWSSARPNLQNISKRRDPDYKRLLGSKYKYKLRSILKASPGHVLIEADYVGAELFGMAVMAGDKVMIDHAIRNQLPENDPRFYDIHSNVAVRAFKLTCAPTKSGLENIGKIHLRIVAKSVIFGIAYGRGAKAISVAAKEEGIDITVDEAQAVIDAIFNTYPQLKPFFNTCKQRGSGTVATGNGDFISGPRYLANCFGRFRRFPCSDGNADIRGEFERQAMNFPIQSMIASVVSRALGYLMDYQQQQRKKGHDMFRLLLQVHDAILLEVPFKYVKHVCTHVLPTYMRKAVPIYPTHLDGPAEGEPTGDGPYYLGIEGEVMLHWGEKIADLEAKKHKLPTGTCIVDGCVFHYSKPSETQDLRSVSDVKNRTVARNIAPPPVYNPKAQQNKSKRRY